MKNRGRHVGRNYKEKEYYNRKIKTFGYDPTVEDENPFGETDSGAKYYSLPKASGVRKRGLQERLSEHFVENWIGWVLGIIATVILIFGFDFNRELGTIGGILNETKNVVSGNSTKLENINEKIHQYELDIQKIDSKVDYLEKDLEKSKTKK